MAGNVWCDWSNERPARRQLPLGRAELVHTPWARYESNWADSCLAGRIGDLNQIWGQLVSRGFPTTTTLSLLHLKKKKPQCLFYKKQTYITLTFTQITSTWQRMKGTTEIVWLPLRMASLSIRVTTNYISLQQTHVTGVVEQWNEYKKEEEKKKHYMAGKGGS